jgi:pimeloyl-ACP methyl ester carboxylesterase
MSSWSRVNRAPQPIFRAFGFQNLAMNLHEHEGPQPVDTLVIFVHGLNGSGYKTWGSFPELAFNGEVSPSVVDVAIFDYFSGKRRWKRVKPRAHLVADTLAQCVAEVQPDYEQIYVVAHSMGGLISKDAVRIYLQKYDADRTLLKRLAGVILFASPMRGSRWALPFLTPLIFEIGYLRYKSRYQARIRKYFREFVDTTDLPQKGNRDFMVPIYAARADHDWLVTPASATADVFHRQRNNFVANHCTVVKPTAEHHPQVIWLFNVIRKIAVNRSKIQSAISRDKYEKGAMHNPGATNRNVLVTDILQRDTQWHGAYQEVLAGASTTLVEVVDTNTSRSNADLLLSVADANKILNDDDDTNSYLSEAKRRHKFYDTEVRVVPVGSEHALAVAHIERTLPRYGPPNSPPWLLIDGAPDLAELKELLASYIQSLTVMIERGMKWARDKESGHSRIGKEESSLIDYGDFV